MLKHKYPLEIRKNAYGGQVVLDAWTKENNTYVLRDLFNDVIYFETDEYRSLFKINFGGKCLDNLCEE